ncbi:MAG: hypothetical protein ACXW4U_10025 [Anaerolineales bacterium]
MRHFQTHARWLGQAGEQDDQQTGLGYIGVSGLKISDHENEDGKTCSEDSILGHKNH